MDLAGHSVDAEAVDAVGVDLELQDRLGDRNHLGERRPRSEIVVQNHDPIPVVAQLQLGLRENHPVGDDAPELRLPQLLTARHRRAGERHGDGLAGGDVGGTADDRPVPLAGIDLAYPKAVGVGMLLGRDHPADDKSLGRRRADVVDPLDLGRVHGKPFGEL